ncbi:MAG: hypothetical protein IPM29_23560 [Planctomycetes bacterium]|nr:hypothetical protein [Planctomycetota bacterium]
MLLYLLIAVVLIAVVLSTRARGGPPGVLTKCRGCRHARKLFPDGTLCGFGKREVFKNEVHVGNCVDRSPR